MLDKVDPTGGDGSEMIVEAKVGGQVTLDGRDLVGGGVVEDEMHGGLAGTSRSILTRNFWSSIVRWRVCGERIPLPVGGE